MSAAAVATVAVARHGVSPAGATGRRLASQRGAALLTVLVMVVILGLTASMAGQSLRASVQREAEAELLWRGEQYRRAIASYYNVKHGAQQMYPATLEDLLRDPRFPGVTRHLRRLYPDPMRGKEWELIRDPAERIIGVRSLSTLEPFRQAGFPEGLEHFAGMATYRDWEFVFTAEGTAPAPAQAQGSETQTP